MDDSAAMDVIEHALRHRGAARWDDLLSQGVSAAQVRTAVRRGLLVRVEHGTYALRGASAVDLAAAQYRGVPTCVTALEAWDLPLLSAPNSTHLAVPPERHIMRPPKTITVHREQWCARLPQGDRKEVSVPSALAHATRCLSPRELLAVTDAALARGIVSREELRFAGRRTSKHGHWLHTMADPRAESMIETFARLELVEAGFRVEPQVWLPGVGRVDLLVNRAVIVETDGREFHLGEASFSEDRRRDRVAQGMGLAVLRFTYGDVVHHPGAVADAVRRVIEVRRHPGGGRSVL